MSPNGDYRAMTVDRGEQDVAGNPPDGMIIQSGGQHGFYKEESNLKLYTEMLKFFDRHIGGKARVASTTTH